MPTQWRYRRAGRDVGPVSFRELIELVRAGKLRSNDLVRGPLESEWRTASSVVGLFHMARKEADSHEAVEKVASQPSTATPDSVDSASRESAPDNEDPARAPMEQASWFKRLQQVTARRAATTNAEARARQQDAAALRLEREIQNTASAAAARVSDRHSTTQVHPWRSSLAGRVPQPLLQALFRYGLGLAAANLVALGVLSWSDTAAQRFPDPSALAAGMRNFPLWGECGSGLFHGLLGGTAAMAGGLGYLCARMLELLVDD